MPFSKQETFDTVAKHLLTQKKKAWTRGTGCAYRGEDGTKCAVGCLIPDDRYDSDLEGAGLTINRPEGYSHPRAIRLWDLVTELGHNTDLLSSLQVVHDYSSPEIWVRELGIVARRFHLNDEVLNVQK